MFNKYIIMPFILILVSIVANIFLDYYSMPKRLARIDQSQHFYDMKKWYESGKLPTTSARFIASQVVNDELTTPRVPGGAYYIFYTLFYRLSGETLLGAKIINLIFNLLIISIFLFWCYKKFGLIIVSFITPLILCNGYFVMATTDFWNPNLSLIFSFLLFILIFEYIDNSEEDYKRKNIVRISAIFIFPILAIMAQGHFFTFFSLIPTIILYLIIKYKRTLKYILYWIIGVFISFLEYLPYLMSEIQNNFSNLNMIFKTKDGFRNFPFPQIHAIAIFPTNEMSVFFSTKFKGIMHFWTEYYPITILGVIFLFITLIFSSICIINGIYFTFNKKYKANSNNEKVLIEMMMIFLLYIPTTIVCNLATGQFSKIHYMYPFFALSYIPMILFFVQNLISSNINNKLFYSIFAILFINIFIMSLQITAYVKNYEQPRNVDSMKKIANIILNDVKGQDANVVEVYEGSHDNLYRDIAITYFPETVWNQNDESTNLYIVLDKIGTFSFEDQRIFDYTNYLNSNSSLIGDTGNFAIYKYLGIEAFRKP
ncbi:hypothetical protein [Brachyspira pilosicoli]|uniref:hypothetical protein n=1 Tax=Brachyspira pilosicoli TaxID=52584 RepID=UPI0030047F0C